MTKFETNEGMTSDLESPESLEWLTTDEAATYLRLSVGALNNMASNGQVPVHKLGRRNRYLRAELRQLLLSERRGR